MVVIAWTGPEKLTAVVIDGPLCEHPEAEKVKEVVYRAENA